VTLIAADSTQRPMTDEERVRLGELLASSPSRVVPAATSFLLTWVLGSIGFVVAWTIATVIGRMLFGARIGWNSPAGPWIAGGGALLGAVVAAVTTARWLRGWKDARPGLLADLAGGVVTVERLHFTEARRFQEPEHGGLLYFLRAADDRVFAMFDHESQDLAIAGKDPLASPFRPGRELLLARAPSSGCVFSRTFSGPLLEAGAPAELSASPRDWPESDEFCPVAWDDLDRRWSGS
jgi:hypothetical protein